MRARRHAWRAAAALFALLFAAATYPGAVVVSMIVTLTPPPAASAAPQGALPWLHVAHPKDATPYIADDQGRMVLLHGAIPGGLIDFWSKTDPMRADTAPFYPIQPSAYDGRCPDSSPTMPVPPLCQADMARMASFGFNSVRLALSWSLLEPKRGEFNETYVDRVRQVVGWARDLGMYVIIDMHQNAYSRYVGAPEEGIAYLRYYSGAPAWATITDRFQSRGYLGQREVNPAVTQAATNFWYDRDGIQDEYIAAVAMLAQRFKDDSTVAGYSVFNEPWPGWNLPPGFEDLMLFPFYRRVIDAVTGIHDGAPCWTRFFMPAVCGYPDLGVRDQRHLFFLDTGLLREVTDFPTHLGLPVSSYPNLVLGMHAYTHVYTFDKLAGQKEDKATYPWGGYDQSYALAEREAKAINAALFVAELGNEPALDALLLANQLLEQERHKTGFAFWTWKESWGGRGWGMFDPVTGCLRVAREFLLARVYPRASADRNLRYHYDDATGAFSLHADGRSGDAPTLVFIPNEVRGAVALTGGVARQSIDALEDGGRIVTVYPSGGEFGVAVSPQPLVSAGCA
ncbi:MAG TPA: cellulase family glycosylhydrolase [Candidatus Dormibacteraeota bacterium]